MKGKNLLGAIVFVVSFVIITKLFPDIPRHTSSTVSYDPDGYKETIKASINGVVTKTKQEGRFWVTVNQKKMPFSYDPGALPVDWNKRYPKDFIAVGDSIYKKANNDTFFVIKGAMRWQYVLPK